MGIATVERDGTFSISGDPRVLYTVMMNIRMLIVKNVGEGLILSSTIALRYNCVRRQFQSLNGSNNERKIIDY
jgi:hypothetical protein